MSRMVKTSSANIILESKEYVSKMDEIMRSIYIGEYVIVKYQDFENSKETVDLMCQMGQLGYVLKEDLYNKFIKVKI